MNMKPIKTEADYRTTLKEIETLMAAKYLTPEGERLDMLVTLVEAYETKHYPVSPPDPVEAIKFRMEQLGLSPADLQPYIGASARVSDLLSRKRQLSLRMVKRLHEGLQISYESLLAGVR